MIQFDKCHPHFLIFCLYNLLINSCINPDLDLALEARMNALHIPGMQVAAIKGGAVVWNNSYGIADVINNSPMKNNSLLMIGSISKTMTATIIMQLVNENSLSLDTDINNYLSFSVRNPHFPTTPITIRMLLKHTSGMLDNFYFLYELFPDHGPSDLSVLLQNYLLPGGTMYDAGKNWYQNAAPGEAEIYTSVDATLLAFIAELREGKPFTTIVNERLELPLSMDTGGGWHPDEVASSRMAAGTEISGGRISPQSMLMWPAGSYITNAVSLGSFLAIYTNSGKVGSIQYLPANLVAEMLPKNTAPGFYGLSWHQTMNTFGGRHLWGHGGKTFGFVAWACFDPDNKTGAVVLTNGDIMSSYIFNEILTLVLKKASEY